MLSLWQLRLKWAHTRHIPALQAYFRPHLDRKLELLIHWHCYRNEKDLMNILTWKFVFKMHFKHFTHFDFRKEAIGMGGPQAVYPRASLLFAAVECNDSLPSRSTFQSAITCVKNEQGQVTQNNLIAHQLQSVNCTQHCKVKPFCRLFCEKNIFG